MIIEIALGIVLGSILIALAPIIFISCLGALVWFIEGVLTRIRSAKRLLGIK